MESPMQYSVRKWYEQNGCRERNLSKHRRWCSSSIVLPDSPVFIWEKSLGFLPEYALTRDSGSDINLKTSSDSTPSILDIQSVWLYFRNGPGQRWCHVVLNSFSSWSTTRNKKVIFLEFSPHLRCPDKARFPRQPEPGWVQAHASFDFVLTSHS